MSKFLPNINTPFQKKKVEPPHKRIIKLTATPLVTSLETLNEFNVKHERPKNRYHKRITNSLDFNTQFENPISTTVASLPKHSKKTSVADVHHKSLINDSFYQDLMNRYCRKSPKKSPKKSPNKFKIVNAPKTKDSNKAGYQSINQTQFYVSNPKPIEDEHNQSDNKIYDYFQTEVNIPSRPNQRILSSKQAITNEIRFNNDYNSKLKNFRYLVKESNKRKESQPSIQAYVSEPKEKAKPEKRAKFKVVGLNYIPKKLIEDLVTSQDKQSSLNNYNVRNINYKIIVAE